MTIESTEVGQAGLELHRGSDGHHRVARQQLEEPQRDDGHSFMREHSRAIRGHEREQLPCGGDRFVGDRRDAVEEEGGWESRRD
jgi:hypothetical protein